VIFNTNQINTSVFPVQNPCVSLFSHIRLLHKLNLSYLFITISGIFGYKSDI